MDAYDVLRIFLQILANYGIYLFLGIFAVILISKVGERLIDLAREYREDHQRSFVTYSQPCPECGSRTKHLKTCSRSLSKKRQSPYEVDSP